MICDDCTRGDHCGLPGERSTQCFCQHRPRKRVLKPADGGVEVPQMPPHQDPPAEVPEADTRPFVTLLTEWQRRHRAHDFEGAAVLRKTMISRLSRLGTKENSA